MAIEDFFIDVQTLPDNIYGTVQLAFLGTTYGFILMYASYLITNGSELLLLVPSLAGIVGSVVLPILGAVPDGMIVLFSGLGPNAQEQLSIGVGALAGSTIMLLTVPWFLSIVGGRVNIEPFTRQPNYKNVPKLYPPHYFDLHYTGVAISPLVHTEAYIMLLTALTYLVLQIPGMMHLHETKEEQAANERNYAITGTAICMTFFFGYLYTQYSHSGNPEGRHDKARDEFMRDAIANKEITLLGVMVSEYKAELNERIPYRQHPSTAAATTATSSASGQHSPYHRLASTEKTTYSALASVSKNFSVGYMARLRKILRPFFKLYDVSGRNILSTEELRVVFLDLGEVLSKRRIAEIFQRFDKDGNGQIDYDEFVEGVAEYILTQKVFNERIRVEDGPAHATLDIEEPAIVGSEDDEEIPSDLATLSPNQQQTRIKLRALWMMLLGTALVVLVADPMVKVLAAIGQRTGIPAFYVSFLLAPLASNLSEVVASYHYAQKKTPTTISVSFATLLGAAIMNNTFVLGIFMWLIASQNLAWSFFAETLTILLIELVVGFMALKNKHTVFDGFFILGLYPLSMLFVALLESAGWD